MEAQPRDRSMGDIQTDDDERAHMGHDRTHGSSSDQFEILVGGRHGRTRGARPPAARVHSSCVRPRAGQPAAEVRASPAAERDGGVDLTGEGDERGVVVSHVGDCHHSAHASEPSLEGPAVRAFGQSTSARGDAKQWRGARRSAQRRADGLR
eukprot:5757027-Pyramimonas_sp.AAC.1